MGPMGKPVGFFVCLCIHWKTHQLFSAYFNVVFISTGAKGSKGNRRRNGKIGYKSADKINNAKNLQCCCHGTVPPCDTDSFLLLSTLNDSGLSAYSHLPVAASTEETDKQNTEFFVRRKTDHIDCFSRVCAGCWVFTTVLLWKGWSSHSENSTNIK